MKIRQILAIAGACVLLPAVAQQPVMRHGAAGYLERGRLMMETGNYVGAIDQLGEVERTTNDPALLEQAAYYLALSKFERGDREEGLDALTDFVKRFPTSAHHEQALMKIGDYYFYRGEYADCYDDALLAYDGVRLNALTNSDAEDLTYRKAYCMLRLGRYADAQTIYNTLSRTKRYSDATKFYNAYISYAEGDYDTALKKFEAISNRSGELGYQAQYYVAQMEFARGNRNKVIKLGQSLLRDNANDYFDAELSRLVGESYFIDGDQDKASTYLKKYLSICEGEPQRSSVYALGVTDFNHGDYAACVQRMGKVTAGDDALAQSALLYLGQSEMKLGDMNTAALSFEKAASMTHDAEVRETALYNYAVSKSSGARTPFDKSIDLMEQFLNEYPNSRYAPAVEDYLVDTYLTTTDYDKALTSISRIKNPGKKVLKAKQSVLYNLGVQAISNDKPAEAKQYLNQAVALGNQDPKVLAESKLWLGEALYRNGEYKEAMTNQLAFINSTSASDENYGLAQYNLGYSLLQQKRYDSARVAFEAAIASKTLSNDLLADAYNRIGDTNYYTQKYDAAEASYGKAIAEDKEGTADYAMYQKAMMAGMSKRYESKLTQIDQLVKAYPESSLIPQALLEKGNTLTAMGNIKSAVATYNDLVKRYPKSTEARKALLQAAIAHKVDNNETGAIDAYKKVIRTYPTSEEAQAAAEDMKLLCADRGELKQFADFLKGVPDGPKIDVTEMDKLTFEAAEKAAIATKPDITKMQAYLRSYPNGAYSAKAKYYIGRHNYIAGDNVAAMEILNSALTAAPDASFAEDAIAIKCAILTKQGKKDEALATYKQLAEKSSTDDNLIAARLGIIRLSTDLEKWNDVKTNADALIATGGLTAEEEKEVTLARAVANAHTGNHTAAEKDLQQLARDTQNEYGAQAAYRLAESQFNRGETNAAERTLNNFIEAGTPHAYWLARGFILLSDVLNKQGKTTEAIEYLESLRNNYPGSEQDIFDDIKERINNWRAADSTKTTSKKSKKNKK